MERVPYLYREYLRLPQKQFGTMFCGVRLIHKGPSSVGFSDENSVAKIIVANHDCVTPVEEEFNMMTKLRNINGEHFITPIPIEWGNCPDFLLMSRIGTALSHRKTSKAEYKRAARAMGEFSARIWELGQFIHTDIHMNNFTLPDEPTEKIGIIDIAAVKKADFIEELFWVPLMRKEIPCQTIASTLMEVSGIRIDFGRVESIARERLPKYEAVSTQEHAREIREIVTSNLKEWRDTLSWHQTIKPCLVLNSPN